MSEVRCIEVPKNVGYVNMVFIVDEKPLIYNVSIIRNSDFWGVVVTDPNEISTIKTGNLEQTIAGIEFEVSGEIFTMNVVEDLASYLIVWDRK